jgi:ATP-dependent DNA helicase PIF1
LTITKLGTNFIKAKKITGAQVGREVYVPRVKMSMDDLTTTYKIKRRQYPISVCFATIIIKSQGWSLRNVGLYLPVQVTYHGELYLTISRVTYIEGLNVLIEDSEQPPLDRAKNIVYKEAL